MRPDHWIQLTVLAAAQHGLVTAAQIAATGTSRRTVTRAVASGLLRRVRPSVYVVAGTPPSVWQPLMAAYLAAGTGAVASHRSAGGAGERQLDGETLRRPWSTAASGGPSRRGR